MTDKQNSPAGGTSPCGVVYEMGVDPKECDALMERTLNAAEYLSKNVPGFIEARLMASSDKTSVVLYGAWETRHDWSQSQWDAVVQYTLTDLQETAKHVTFKFYARREQVNR